MIWRFFGLCASKCGSTEQNIWFLLTGIGRSICTRCHSLKLFQDKGNAPKTHILNFDRQVSQSMPCRWTPPTFPDLKMDFRRGIVSLLCIYHATQSLSSRYASLWPNRRSPSLLERPEAWYLDLSAESDANVCSRRRWYWGNSSRWKFEPSA